jgi:MarR family transcriptional regulator, multiple antibiotic resistance protein MarR
MAIAIDTAPVVEIYDPKRFDPRLGIGGLLSRVKAKLVDALDVELAPFDISAAQYVILVNLANGADSSSDLCRSVSYDPGAMTRMLDRLERKGLIRRVRCSEDRRVARLALTDEGRAVYPKLVERAAAVLNRSLRGFSPNEVRQLEVLLQRMLMNG